MLGQIIERNGLGAAAFVALMVLVYQIAKWFREDLKTLATAITESRAELDKSNRDMLEELRHIRRGLERDPARSTP